MFEGYFIMLLVAKMIYVKITNELERTWKETAAA
jgi:hypothetical protein